MQRAQGFWQRVVVASAVAAAFFGRVQAASAADPAQDSPAVALGAEPDERLVELAVVVLELKFKADNKGKDDQNRLVQHGFLLEKDLVATSFSMLAKAEKISVQRLGARKSVPATVVGVDPLRDLALLRLKSAAPLDAGAPTAEAPELAAPEAYSLERDAQGAPLDATHFTLWVDCADSKLRRAIPVSELLAGGNGSIHATPQAARLSGLPLVDASGQLAGMWQWTWAGAEPAAPRIVEAAELRALAAAAKERPLTSFPGAYASAAGRTFALPTIKWGHSETVSNAARRANEFRSLVRCGDCDGKGFKVEVEKTWDGVRWTQTRREIRCPGCGGDRVVNARKRWEAFRTLASIVSNLERDESFSKVAMALENGLAEAFDLNPSVLGHSVFDGGKEELQLRNLAPGRSIAFLVERSLWPAADRTVWGEHVRVVADPEARYPKLLLRKPYARSTIHEGSVAFVTAVVAGPLTVGEDTYVVLERAVVVPIKSSALPAGR
jgi:S1-C subfamily serine protease